MAATITIHLSDNDWKLLRGLMDEYSSSMTESANLMIRLGLYVYNLNPDILEEI